MQGKYKHRSGVEASNWKGDNAGYQAKHIWIREKFGSPLDCEQCKKTVENTRKIQWANISGEWWRERNDWRRLCTSCHRKFDLSRGMHHKHGETHEWSVLSEKQVREIKNKYIPLQYGYRKLAQDYQVSPENIFAIIKGKSWKHIK